MKFASRLFSVMAVLGALAMHAASENVGKEADASLAPTADATAAATPAGKLPESTTAGGELGENADGQARGRLGRAVGSPPIRDSRLAPPWAVALAAMVAAAILAIKIAFGLARRAARTCGSWTEPGPKPVNEDCVFAGKLTNAAGVTFHLAVVADGISNSGLGDQASSSAINAIVAFMKEGHFTSVAELRCQVQAAVAAANETVLALFQGDLEPGTTLALVAVMGCDGCLAAVGDTRIYRICDYGVLQITSDHGHDVGRYSGLTRWLGTPELNVDFDDLDNLQGDSLLLVSDGVYRWVNEEDMACLHKSRKPSGELCRQLVSKALSAGSQDNATACLMHIHGRL